MIVAPAVVNASVVTPTETPLNPEPSPVKEVAEQTPTIAAPALVVVNLFVLLKYNST